MKMGAKQNKTENPGFMGSRESTQEVVARLNLSIAHLKSGPCEADGDPERLRARSSHSYGSDPD